MDPWGEIPAPAALGIRDTKIPSGDSAPSLHLPDELATTPLLQLATKSECLPSEPLPIQRSLRPRR